MTTPYAGYDNPSGQPLFEPPSRDERLQVMERVVGITDGGDAVAVLRSAIARAGVIEIDVGGRQLVVWHRPGQASALDMESVSGGRDIGTVGVFSVLDGGRHLHFVPERQGFRDRETGSSWNVLGQATAGPLAGRSLEPHTHLDTFWFAWVVFQPRTRLVGPRRARCRGS